MVRSPSRLLAALVLGSAPSFAEPPAVEPVATVAEPPQKSPAAPTGSPAERAKWLSARIDEILSVPSLAGAKVGIAVADVETGKAVYARADGVLYNPASNVKLVTTIAALATLGPEFRWKTSLYSDGAKGGEIEGNLYLKGSGDPSLVGEDLWKLASDLASLGVKKINGDLAIDDSYFDDARVGPGFEQKGDDLPFRAPNGAVSLNYNACSVHVLPGDKEGAPGRVVVEPASPYFSLVNESRSVAAGHTHLTIAARESGERTEIKVTGRIKVGDAPHVEFRRVAHPDLYTGYAFRELLLRRGIKFAGKVVRLPIPAGAKPMVSHYSAPLGVLARDVNKHSNNFMAEQVLKTLGAEAVSRPGTWPKGVEAVGRFLDGVGIHVDQYKMTNGSGLYDSNRFSPSQIVTLLRNAYRDFRYAADFVGSLAVAGADGTIGHRMEGGLAERYVRAKTGTLAGVSCLSGFAGAPGRPPLAFSILMNDVGESGTADARRAQDAIAETLVVYLQAK